MYWTNIAAVCVLSTGDNEDAEFFYDEEEVLAGADSGSRAAMLDHYDSLLQMPRADDLDEVRFASIVRASGLAPYV